MQDLELIIGNKNYSSWSLRPWIALTYCGIAFRETLSPFDDDNHNVHYLAFSPVARVPVLKRGSATIWESLAILEYLAEVFPDARLWPSELEVRTKARVISNEMHAGFGALRNACPMNMRRAVRRLEVGEPVRKDVSRITDIWTEALNCSGGPFLFGRFTIADAMYAPVVNRFHVYELTSDQTARQYMNHMMSLPAYEQWQKAAAAEPWVVEHEEV